MSEVYRCEMGSPGKKMRFRRDESSVLKEQTSNTKPLVQSPISTRNKAKSQANSPVDPKLLRSSPNTRRLSKRLQSAEALQKTSPIKSVKSTPVSKTKASTALKTPKATKTPQNVRKAAKEPKSASKSASKTVKHNSYVNLFAEARRLLHPSAVPETLSCRSSEFCQILYFVKDALVEEVGGCMYISGVPGTGKTATVLKVIRHLSAQQAEQVETIPEFKFIEVNGLKLTDPQQFYVSVYHQLTGEKTSKQNAVNYLDSYFGKSTKRNKRDPFVIMLVDELDLLCTKRQNILYHLFDWPNRPNSRLVILSIANTMDLPERMMMNRVSSRLGLTRLTFQPYSFVQLQEIVNARVQGLGLFDQDGVQLIARKVAAISGDARRVLDICRRAVDVAEAQFENSRLGTQGKRQVTLLHVNQALKDIFSSEKLTAITEASEQQRLLLQAIVQDFRCTGLEEAVFRDVYTQHVSICHFSNAYAPSPSELLNIAYELFEVKLILIDKNRVDMLKRIRLNVSVDDVNFGLQSKAD